MWDEFSLFTKILVVAGLIIFFGPQLIGFVVWLIVGSEKFTSLLLH